MHSLLIQEIIVNYHVFFRIIEYSCLGMSERKKSMVYTRTGDTGRLFCVLLVYVLRSQARRCCII